MEGEFHFDATPIVPPGSAMLMHKKTRQAAIIWIQHKESLVPKTMPQALPNLHMNIAIHRWRKPSRHSVLSTSRDSNTGLDPDLTNIESSQAAGPHN